MSHDLSLKETQKEWHGSYSAYAIGLIASFILTCTSFYLVMVRPVANHIIIGAIITLAVIQAIFQVLFFLHVGKEDKPRWETLLFFFMVLVVLIIVLGSLWIMYDLDARVMIGMDGR